MSKSKNNVSVQSGASNLAYRLLSAIVVIACVAAFFLPYTLFASTPSALFHDEKKLYELFELLPDAPYKFLSLIPLFTNPKSVLGLAGGLVTYALVATLALAFILAFISFLFGKKAEKCLVLSALIYTWGAALYMIAVLSITCYLPMKVVFDHSSILLAAIGTLAYVLIIFAKLGKKLCIVNCVRFLFTLAFTACLFLALTYDYKLVSKLIAKSFYYKAAMVGAIALTLFNVILASARASKRKAFAFDIIVSSLEMAVAIGLVALSLCPSVMDITLLIFGCIVGGIALALFILAFMGLDITKQRTEKKTCAKARKEETYIPVVPIEEPTKTTEPTTTVEEIEDFFAGKKIDAFIKTLDVVERNQFASLYIVKEKDVMSEIPAYKVDGDNQNFFEMVFITLGDYRDEIPDGLLSKFYNYVCVAYPQIDCPLD